MQKALERDLGLFSVLAISIGAMVGSGIFILPALAVKIAGPAVILAYVIAGLLVLPAALSKSEMATAMPEAGGTYLYIERGMGPLLGTVAGLGTWFSLSFKGALALVGGVPYLLLLFDVPQSVVTPVALVLAALLVLVNLFGAKQTGRLQVGIVAIMLAALVWFAVGGTPSVQQTNYSPFFTGGVGGLLAATGLVFVSYAGVTKIASVAEEVEDPDRNIPLGIVGSLAFTTLLYTLIVAVMVGVTDPGTIADTSTPMAVAAEATLGTAGVVAIVVAAILALVSTANAGILSSSRYPFAMARDNLVPSSLSVVSDRFGTPSTSITVTGVVLLLLIAFVPILDIAKLASAFQILVFVLINFAIVAFREGNVEYEPSFESPLYPWTQAFGIVGGVVLLTQMGTVPFVGAVVMTAAGIVWYYVYARPRVDREGAAIDAVRRQIGQNAVERTRDTIEEWTSGYRVLVALPDDVSKDRERSFVRVAADLARPLDGRVTVVRFQEVPDQVPLAHASEVESPADLQFERQTDELDEEFDVPVDSGTIVSHDTKHAVVNYADHEEADMLLMEHDPGASGLRGRLFGNDTDWVMRHAPCDVTLLDDRGLDEIETVGVLTDEGPYDPTKVAVADALASEAGATVALNHAVDVESRPTRARTIREYHEEIGQLCSAPVRTGLPFADGGSSDEPPHDDDVLVVGVGSSDQTQSRIVDEWGCSVLMVHGQDARRRGRLARLADRWLF
ncbi:universal stress protein [Halopelagius longus]|uniref:Amino acid transporter n=1 Tax=Halopelagius longus TaxID=1236180 RepID=A0A1H1FHL9_9EURY|nr:universal stress protein [Halopelagius longus]RDI70094.1 amino acid transporter [Halopelagius longus]SDR00522.1 amino acid/polyamine/organocation transporter, APC superfamily [Halopelagius longus]